MSGQTNKLNWKGGIDLQKLYTFWSVNGGVGKTTLSSNVALKTAMLYPSSKVALLDFNLFNPDIDLYLGMQNKDIKYGLEFFVKNQINFENISEYLTEYEAQKNLKILTGLYDINFFDKLNTEHFTLLLEYLKQMFDYIFIDIDSSLNIDATFISIYSCDKLIVVGEPQYVTLRNINRYINDVLFKMGIPSEKIKIIINNYESLIQKSEINHVLKNDVFYINSNKYIKQSTNKGKPFVLSGNKKLKKEIKSIERFIYEITKKGGV